MAVFERYNIVVDRDLRDAASSTSTWLRRRRRSAAGNNYNFTTADGRGKESDEAKGLPNNNMNRWKGAKNQESEFGEMV